MSKVRKILALVLVAVTLLGVFAIPAAAYSYPMAWTIYYKSTDGKTLGTKTGTIDAAADVRNSLSVASPSYSGYSLQNASDATVTGGMFTWYFPASNYVRNGSGSYTVYYVKNVSVSIYYLYGTSKRTAATTKTLTGAPSATYMVYSPSVTGYSPTSSYVYDTYGNGNKYVYYYEKTYTITFDANGGSGAPSSVTKYHFTNLTLPATVPKKTGYMFLGWSTGSTAISATWSAGGTYSTNASNTLYAVWEPKTYTINYNANGGSGAPSSQTKTYGINITIPTSKPSRTGYDFVGWGYVSDATGAAYYPGDTYSTNYSRTFYAVWSPKIYTISYNANGGSGAPASQTKTYGQDITLSSTKPTRTGYTFAGWSISKNGSVSYSAGATFKGNSSTTLYAVWTCNHTSSTKKWIDSCNWQTVCDTCGATLSSGITHGPYTYSAWTYYSSTQHKRTKGCDHGDYSTTEYASHVTSTKYEQYNSSQHKYYSYCSTCGTRERRIETSYDECTTVKLCFQSKNLFMTCRRRWLSSESK